MADQPVPGLSRLTDRQREVLSLAARGYTREESAAEMECTALTISKVMNAAAKAIGARTTKHAVVLWLAAEAVARGVELHVPVVSAPRPVPLTTGMVTEALRRHGDGESIPKIARLLGVTDGRLRRAMGQRRYGLVRRGQADPVLPTSTHSAGHGDFRA